MKMNKPGLLMFALGAMGFALSAAAADSAVGTMQDVKGGVVVMMQGQDTQPAANGLDVLEGASILAARDGRATVVLNNGCRVSVGPSQQLTVNSKIECKALLASVQQLVPSGQVVPTAATAAAPGGMGAVMGVGGVLGLGAVVGLADHKPVSAQ